MTKYSIGWIGLGKCGFPIAEEIAKKITVLSHDIVFKETQYSEFKPKLNDLLSTNAIFVLVQTPHNDVNLDGSIPIDFSKTDDFDYATLTNLLHDLDRINYENDIVICSTVSPGTIRNLSNKFHKLNIAYMPVMIHIGSVAHDYINAPMYYIGTKDGKPNNLIESILSQFVKTNDILTGTWEEVEIYKLMGNIFSSIKIAFANTISEFIEYGDFNASSFNIIDALLKDTKRFNSASYLIPGGGTGGPCHPRDGVVLSYFTDKLNMESKILKNVAESRQDQSLALAKYLCSFNLPILILGKSFKMGVELDVGSYSVLVGTQCQTLGQTVYYDTAINEKCVVLLAHPDLSLLEKYKVSENDIIIDLWNLNIPNSKVWGNNLKQ